MTLDEQQYFKSLINNDNPLADKYKNKVLVISYDEQKLTNTFNSLKDSIEHILGVNMFSNSTRSKYLRTSKYDLTYIGTTSKYDLTYIGTTDVHNVSRGYRFESIAIDSNMTVEECNSLLELDLFNFCNNIFFF